MTDPSIAFQPCDLPAVPDYVSQITQLGARVAEGDAQARFSLLKAARGLVNALETPRETMIKHCWAQVCSRP